MNPSNGKGSRQRPTDNAKFSANWDRIFGKKEPEVELVPVENCSCEGCFYRDSEGYCIFPSWDVRCITNGQYFIYKQVTHGN
jgi:hypothetical protein